MEAVKYLVGSHGMNVNERNRVCAHVCEWDGLHTLGRCGCVWVGGLVSVGCDVYILCRCECGCVWGGLVWLWGSLW